MIQKTSLRTINGAYQSNGLIKINEKIINIKDDKSMFIIDKEIFRYDFQIDYIAKFQIDTK